MPDRLDIPLLGQGHNHLIACMQALYELAAASAGDRGSSGKNGAALSQLYTEGFDAEQIWLQLDMQVRLLLSALHCMHAEACWLHMHAVCREEADEWRAGCPNSGGRGAAARQEAVAQGRGRALAGGPGHGGSAGWCGAFSGNLGASRAEACMSQAVLFSMAANSSGLASLHLLVHTRHRDAVGEDIDLQGWAADLLRNGEASEEEASSSGDDEREEGADMDTAAEPAGR